MSDPQRVTRSDALPPPAPPLPPSRHQVHARPGVLQRLVAPLGFGLSGRLSGNQERTGDSHVRHDTGGLRNFSSHEETTSHRTGISIAALDISPYRTQAILAGKDILKTIRVHDGKVTEEFNLRSALSSYSSTRNVSASREFLPSTDVKWSHTEHDSKIATAANNGRIVLYDLAKPEIEIARLHEHDRQVHKLAFNPFSATKLLSGSQDGTLRLWDLRLLEGQRGALTMKAQNTFQGRSEAIRDVRWSTADGFEFAFCTDSGSVQLWDFRQTTMPKLRIHAHERPCFVLDWHPDGKHVATGGLDRDVKIWDFSNPDRRQKPSLVLRTPQSIMNLRWRPACWSWEVQESGDWQCTQLVTSYNYEDSRLHIWDLRRPYIPFREIDRSPGPASGLLWHSKDLLWTVGNEGTFQQTDTKYASQITDQLNSAHISFTPDGQFVKISEKRSIRSQLGLQESADAFLNQHLEPETGKSRSWEEDETASESYMTTHFRRKQSRGAARYPKSQGNTPPSRDERIPVLPLERSLRKGVSFKARQIGLIQEITGASLHGPAFRHLAQNYARPTTDLERRERPEAILERLEAAFLHNADLCREVSMYRLAQTWQILRAVVLPDLEARARANREQRLHAHSLQAAAAVDTPEKALDHSDVLYGKYSVDPSNRADKVQHRLFKGILEAESRTSAANEHSTSNMSTPLAKPLPDSPLSDRGRSSYHYSNLTETIESIAPLPESVLSSHNTAAVAAESLRDPSLPDHSSSSSSPQQTRRQRRPSLSQNLSDISPKSSSNGSSEPPHSSPQAIVTSPTWHGVDRNHEENRRAALRDYRAQTKPLLTLDSPTHPVASRPIAPARHDSNESFAMFSTSTASSHKTRSTGRSADSPQIPHLRQSLTQDSWQGEYKRPEDHPKSGSTPSDESGKHGNLGRMFGASNREDSFRNSTLSELGAGTSVDFRFEPDSPVDARQAAYSKTHGTGQPDFPTAARSKDDSSFEDSVFGRPTEDLPYNFEPMSFPSHAPNPAVYRPVWPKGRDTAPGERRSGLVIKDDLSSKELIYSDFQPIAVATSGRTHPPAWDAFSLIAAAVEFDLTASHDNATCQFSAHLLMHIVPYFDCFRAGAGPDVKAPASASVSSRLRLHSYARRIVESVLSTYLQFLQAHELFAQAAEVKNFAYDHAYDIFSTEGSSLVQDLRLLLTCGHCGKPLGGQNVGLVCIECYEQRDPCPICLCSDVPSELDDVAVGHSMWTTCTGCGHGGHVDCLSAWLGDAESEGACPAPGCWHDCGPGSVRNERVAMQQRLWEREIAGRGLKAGRGPAASARKDSWVVPQSPAVGRARRELRDPSFSRKQVRLLAPGEMSSGVVLSSSQ